eukprot:4685016-Amphidinium_carterae.5
MLHVRGHVIFRFEEDGAGDGVVRHEHAFHDTRSVHESEEEQEHQEPAEMKVPGPGAPTDEERKYHNLRTILPRIGRQCGSHRKGQMNLQSRASEGSYKRWAFPTESYRVTVNTQL